MIPGRDLVPARLAGWLTLASLAPGCAALDRHAERKIPQYGVVAADVPRELEKVSMPAHVVEPPDELQIEAQPPTIGFGTRTVKVQPDGTLDLDFFGDVYVNGLTLPEVERKISQQLTALSAQKRLTAPVRVAVRLADGQASKRYYVLGTVANANSFPITGNETVLDGVLMAGLKSNSLPDKAYLVRPHPANGADQVFAIDWFGITQRGDTQTNYQLMPGDRIYVPGTRPPSLLKSLLSGS